jgi:hypothetical protein
VTRSALWQLSLVMAPFATRATARSEAVFDQFVSDTEPRVRRALIATYGAAVERHNREAVAALEERAPGRH